MADIRSSVIQQVCFESVNLSLITDIHAFFIQWSFYLVRRIQYKDLLLSHSVGQFLNQ